MGGKGPGKATEARCVVLSGQYEHTIDGKGRLAIPAKCRRADLGTAEPGSVWYCIPWHTGHLRLYTERTFHQFSQHGVQTLTPNEGDAELQRLLYSSAQPLEMDSAGRVVLPKSIIDYTQLTSDVTVIGAKDRLEVHSRAAWKATEAQRATSMAALMAKIEAAQRHGSSPPAPSSPGHG